MLARRWPFPLPLVRVLGLVLVCWWWFSFSFFVLVSRVRVRDVSHSSRWWSCSLLQHFFIAKRTKMRAPIMKGKATEIASIRIIP